MPLPIHVELLPHAASWKIAAVEKTARLLQALDGNVVTIHHIGSTAIPGIHAKPVVDLMPVVRCASELDGRQSVLQRLGYHYWGEYGIPGRRYCTFDEPSTGRRLVQLHCFEAQSLEIERHLAFRDYLIANPAIADEYDREKHRCQQLHPDDFHAYSDEKAPWIAAHLSAALACFRSSRSLE